LCPLAYDSTKSYPLVLFLHGAGQRGTDNVAQYTYGEGATLWAQTQNQQTYPCFVLSPQCPAGNSGLTQIGLTEAIYKIIFQ